jgi:homoserine acetyltransferase
MPDEEEVKATIFGTPVAVKGINMLVVVVLAAALGVIIYFTVTGNEAQHASQSDMQTREHQAVIETLKEINQTNEKIQKVVEENGERVQKAVDENSYMVLADEKERKDMKAKLGRPSSLSKKLKGE